MEENENEKDQESSSMFRQSAIEYHSGRSQFEHTLQSIQYKKWIILASLAILFIGSLTWFFFGSIPIEAEGIGIAVNVEGLSNIETAFSGVVKNLNVHVGEQIKKGDVIAILYNPEIENQLLSAKQIISSLKKRLKILRDQVEKEKTREKKALLESIEASHFKMQVLEKEIPVLQRDVFNKEDLAIQGLFDSQSLQDSKELLWSKQIDLEKSRANLSHLQFLLKKGYRQEEIDALNEQLLETIKERKILETQLTYKNIYSPVTGTLLEWFIQPNKYVSIGELIARSEIQENEKEGRKVFYGYLPVEIGRRVRLNAEVAIQLTNVKSQEFGAILGNIASVSQYATSPENLSRLINNPDLIDYFLQKNAAITEVIIEPQLDPNTVSGFHWTSGKGPPIHLTSGTLCTFKGLVEEVPPYLYFLPTWWIRKMIYSSSISE